MTEELTKYQLEHKAKAEKLADEVAEFGYKTEVNREDDCSYYQTLFTADGNEYKINRDWHGYIDIHEHPYPRYDEISTNNIYHVTAKITTSNKMKVLTAKKLAVRIAEQVEAKKQLDILVDEYKITQSDFIKSLKGQNVTWSKDKMSGYIRKNGLEYSFEILLDGYIKQDIRLVSYEHTIDNFLALAKNKYIEAE